MQTYWSAFITEHLSELPYWTLSETLEKFYDYLTVDCRFQQVGEAPQWATVGERTPEIDDEILVYNAGAHCSEIATWDGARLIDTTGLKTNITNVVTHWMPLPSPPTATSSDMDADRKDK